jgi:Fic family protein
LDLTLFKESKTGELVTITGGLHAFVPQRLPISLSSIMTLDVALALARAEAELGRLDGIGSKLPQPELLIAPFLRKEAEFSSRIEGTHSTFVDIMLYEVDRGGGAPKPDTPEVANYVTALQYAIARSKETRISRVLLCETHALLLRGTVQEALGGRFRDHQVHIGSGRDVGTARFVPPPAHEVIPLIDNLEEYLAHNDETPALIRAAIAHYQFETIHPFLDGNGRIGRLLIPLLLCEAKALAAPMLYLSEYFEQRRIQYIDALFHVSASGRWSEWIIFFLQAVAVQARDAILRVQRLDALRKYYHTLVEHKRRAVQLMRLIDALFALPMMTNRVAKEMFEISKPQANEYVQELIDLGILELLSLRGRTKVFIAPQIVDIVEGPADERD